MRRELTGRHVLIITLAAFGVIIAVNITMAVKAVGTFPGLEVKNSYVASQGFDRERAAQDALGWTVMADYDGEWLEIAVTDADGLPAPAKNLSVTIGRPTHVRADQSPELAYRNGVYRAAVSLPPGVWNIHVTAAAPDGTPFRQRLDHYSGAVVN
ncbi:FixH family protein [Paracoccus sp. Z330]|uniref:FixH family protein n=1 Tax=Paracoccus onchidii TaxID=3017813 RepID=A0ABT4Z9X2_9RHOB|nr:FixH family protein [Paracoccus onchidii]MDB6176152.1 FixH family protein [Paracoccus onchidii]